MLRRDRPDVPAQLAPRRIQPSTSATHRVFAGLRQSRRRQRLFLYSTSLSPVQSTPGSCSEVRLEVFADRPQRRGVVPPRTPVAEQFFWTSAAPPQPRRRVTQDRLDGLGRRRENRPSGASGPPPDRRGSARSRWFHQSSKYGSCDTHAPTPSDSTNQPVPGAEQVVRVARVAAALAAREVHEDALQSAPPAADDAGATPPPPPSPVRVRWIKPCGEHM